MTKEILTDSLDVETAQSKRIQPFLSIVTSGAGDEAAQLRILWRKVGFLSAGCSSGERVTTSSYSKHLKKEGDWVKAEIGRMGFFERTLVLIIASF